MCYYFTMELSKNMQNMVEHRRYFRSLLVVPCPMTKVNGKLYKPSPGSVTKSLDPLGIKV